MKKIAKCKDLKFKTRESFDKWLKQATKYEVEFEDKGQDFLHWWIDKDGEVLHSELQAWLWNGKIVDISSIKKGKYLRFCDGACLNYKIIKVKQKRITRKNIKVKQ